MLIHIRPRIIYIYKHQWYSKYDFFISVTQCLTSSFMLLTFCLFSCMRSCRARIASSWLSLPCRRRRSISASSSSKSCCLISVCHFKKSLAFWLLLLGSPTCKYNVMNDKYNWSMIIYVITLITVSIKYDTQNSPRRVWTYGGPGCSGDKSGPENIPVCTDWSKIRRDRWGSGIYP